MYQPFGAIFAITREKLKLRPQVRHCKKAIFRRIFWGIDGVFVTSFVLSGLEKPDLGVTKNVVVLFKDLWRERNKLEKFVLHEKVGHDQSYKNFKQKTLTCFFGGVGEKVGFQGVFLLFFAFEGPYLQFYILLRSESPSSMCAKLRTVAASNNRDHAPQSLCYCLFAPHIFGVVLRVHPVRGESHIQRNASGDVATTPKNPKIAENVQIHILQHHAIPEVKIIRGKRSYGNLNLNYWQNVNKIIRDRPIFGFYRYIGIAVSAKIADFIGLELTKRCYIPHASLGNLRKKTTKEVKTVILQQR